MEKGGSRKLGRGGPPCCSVPRLPAHVRVSRGAERQTCRGRRPAERSQSHHLDLSKHSGEGAEEEEEEGEATQGESQDPAVF